MAKKNSTVDLRSQLKATPIKSLKKQIDDDNKLIGAYSSNEYLSLEDGKAIAIRIFPAHPGVENFYVPKKCYWLSIAGNDGDMRRAQVLDSRAHGGTKFDLVDEYVKWAKKKWAKDSDKLNALTGTAPNSNSLNPQYSWLCYADHVIGDTQLKPKIWEFKKMVRDALNKLAFSEDEDEAIEIDPFTDPDEGLPILVKYMKNPNKKKGETYYEVSFPRKVKPRPLTDEEIEYFMSLKPLNELLPKYSMRDFERALEGLQNFDSDNEIGLFDDDDWLEHVEEIKTQYDDDSSNDETEKSLGKKNEKPSDDDDEEEADDDDEEEADDDELNDLDRQGLKNYIRDNSLDISIKKSMSDDDIRNLIRDAIQETPQPSDDDEEEAEEEAEDDVPAEKPKSKVSLADIKKKLAGKK